MPALAELLGREVKLVQEFVDSLVTEQEALTQGKVDTLESVNRRKTALVEQLNAADNERNGFLRQAGHTGDREGLLAWLANNRGDQPAAKGWARLQALAVEAKRLNDLNGRLITMRLQATNQALAALTQQSQRSLLYGPNGQTTSRTGSRIIDAA